MCFSYICPSKYHKSIMQPLQLCTFSHDHLFLVSIFYQLTSEKNKVHTDELGITSIVC